MMMETSLEAWKKGNKRHELLGVSKGLSIHFGIVASILQR